MSELIKTPRVADFSTHYSGPIASRQLVQLGADVIKIEGLRVGDGLRGLPPLADDGISTNHLFLNAGTRSLGVDIRSAAWPEVVRAAAQWADIVIVGNRPAVTRARGIDYGSMVRHNCELVYCMITGYGLDGPLVDAAAHGLQMDLLAGGVPIEWVDGEPKVQADYRSIGTTLAGIEAALGSLAALHRRDQGQGAQFVHVSIWESVLAWKWRDLVTYANTGHPWTDYRDLGPRYCTYAGSDGQVVLVCPMEQHFWERFCDVLDLPASFRERGDWSGGSDYGDAYPGEYEVIRDRMLERPAAEWVRSLSAADVPVAPVADWRETMSSEHAQANGVMTSYEYRGRSVPIPATAVSVSGGLPVEAEDAEFAQRHREKAAGLMPPPDIGADTEQVLAEFGLSHLAGQLGARR